MRFEHSGEPRPGLLDVFCRQVQANQRHVRLDKRGIQGPGALKGFTRRDAVAGPQQPSPKKVPQRRPRGAASFSLFYFSGDHFLMSASLSTGNGVIFPRIT
jgi:hypothetical protein